MTLTPIKLNVLARLGVPENALKENNMTETTEVLIARLRSQSTEIGDRADVETLMHEAADHLAALTTPQEGGVIKSPKWPDGCALTVNELAAPEYGHLDCTQPAPQVGAARALVQGALDGLSALDLDSDITREGTAWGSILRDAKADLSAALDAEPESEWEYGHEGDTLIGVHANASRAQAVEDAEHLTRYWEPHGKKFRAVRRRKAGPWEPLPVGGDTSDE